MDASADVLLRALVYPCLEAGNLCKFNAALKSIDPTLESFRCELSAASNHFMNEKMYNVAYIFQALLQVSFHCHIRESFGVFCLHTNLLHFT